MDPLTPRHSTHLSRDQRLQIQTLWKAGFKRKQIQDHLSLTYWQIRYACLASRPTPKKRSGRPPVLSEEQIDEIKLFVCSKRSNRLLSYERLALEPFQKFSVSSEAIKNALERREYNRYVAYRKAPLSE